MSDDHKNSRGSLERPAWAMLDAKGSPQECVLRDVWKTGARLRFPSPVEVPADFILNLAYDGRVARKCTVTSRSDDRCEIEVEFVARRIPVAAYPRPIRDEPRASRPAAGPALVDKTSLAC